MASEIKTIDIDNIIVNVINPRYEPQESELKEMDMILNDEKAIVLIKDIAQYGLDPSENLIVSYVKEMDAYVSEEGNRRVTAIKVLNDPGLIPSFTKDREKLINQVIKIRKETAFSYIKEINCVIIDDSDTKQHFIELKHTGENKGAGRVRWNTESQARYKTDDIFREHLLMFIKSIHPNIKDNFGLTTVERIISDPDMRTSIGIVIDRRSPEIRLVDHFSKLKLYYILDGLLNKSFNVNTFFHKTDREKFAKENLLNEHHKPWNDIQSETNHNEREDSDNTTQNNLWNYPIPNDEHQETKNPVNSPIETTSTQSTNNENNNGNNKIGRPFKEIREFDILTKAIPFKNQYRKNERIKQTLKEISQIQYKENLISSMYLIRNILETYVHLYIDHFASLPNDHAYKMKGISPKREKRVAKSLQELVFDNIKIHLKYTIEDHAEAYKSIEVNFSNNNKTSVMKIINYYIHSSEGYPDKEEVLDSWRKISKIIITLDQLLEENVGQK